MRAHAHGHESRRAASPGRGAGAAQRARARASSPSFDVATRDVAHALSAMEISPSSCTPTSSPSYAGTVSRSHSSTDGSPRTPTSRTRRTPATPTTVGTSSSSSSSRTPCANASGRPPLPPTPPPEANARMTRTGIDEVRILSRRARASDDEDADVGRTRLMIDGGEFPARVAELRARTNDVIDLSAEMFDADAPYVEVLHIPNAKVGLVIGREGRHVSFVQARTRTRISIARDSWDGAKRRVEIEGVPENCALAMAMITRLIESSDDRESDGLDDGAAYLERVANRAMSAARDDDDRERLSETLHFGEEFDGRAQRGHGAMFVAGGHAPVMSSDRAIASKASSAATATMTIPHTKVGMIIGRGGDNVKYIQQSTGARVQIQTDAETPEGAPNRMVYLRGSVEACRNAARMINDQCIGRTMIFSSGPPATPPAPSEGKSRAHQGMGVPPPAIAAYGAPQGMEHYQGAIPYAATPYYGAPYTGLYNAPPTPAYMQGAYPSGDPTQMMHYWNQYVDYCQRMSMYGAMIQPYAVESEMKGGMVYYDQHAPRQPQFGSTASETPVPPAPESPADDVHGADADDEASQETTEEVPQIAPETPEQQSA